MGTHRKRRRVVHLSLTERVLVGLALIAVGALSWDLYHRWSGGPGVGGLATHVFQPGARRGQASVAARRPPPAQPTLAAQPAGHVMPWADPHVRQPTTYTREGAPRPSPTSRAAASVSPSEAPSGAPSEGPEAQPTVRFPTWSDADPPP